MQDGNSHRGELKRRKNNFLNSYQFGQAPLREDPSGTEEVEVSGDPAPHVEPVHSSFGWGAVLSVQQHQLLLGPHRTSFQHALQLEGRHGAQMFYTCYSPHSLHIGAARLWQKS